MIKEIEKKVLAGKRLSFEEGVALFSSNDLLWLGFLSKHIKQRKHPEKIVTYILDRNINYTNICTAECKFCAFSVLPGSSRGYLLSKKKLREKIEDTLARGGVQILLQGGLHPSLKINFYEELLAFIAANFPSIHIHGFSPPEIINVAKISHIPLNEVIIRLKKAGLGSIPGGGAEILVDRIRKELSPNKCNSREWLEVMKSAHLLGLKTTATMMFGSIEEEKDRLTHLAKIRALQDETRGFTAFIPWTFQPANTQIPTEPLTAVDYLKTLAISRIFLDNIDNIQTSWVTQGAKIAQISLEFGANDFGSTMMEENVVKAAGVNFRMSEEEIVRCIEDAGYLPGRRNMHYRILGSPFARR